MEILTAKDRAISDALRDVWWRLNNLYWIVDEDGNQVRFIMRPVQEELVAELWSRNIVLKSRQHGFTTLLSVMALDRCLFNFNYAAGIIAHRMSDAQKIFRNKIQFPYQHLPTYVQDLAPLIKETTEEYVFGNGSSLSVSTSYRSGTLAWLHVSEYGKIAAKFPAKAEEIDTGAFEAVHQSGIITIETTAEGNYGLLKDKVDQALILQYSGKPLARLDWKLIFFAWWQDPKNATTIEEAKVVPIPGRLQKYFDELKSKHGIALTAEQRAWYTVKERTSGPLMWREHPSTVDEPFKVSLKGAYWAVQMQDARKEGRITKVELVKSLPVRTWWDIGRDATAIWFTQDIGNLVHCIDYYEYSNRGLTYYVREVMRIADEREMHFAPIGHGFPHDMGVRDYSNPEEKTRLQVAAEAGLPGRALPRMKHKEDGIDAGREFIPRCIFDEEHCERGIAGLEAYRKEWDTNHDVWSDVPLHNWASHPADAFQGLALNHRSDLQMLGGRVKARQVTQRSAAGWT